MKKQCVNPHILRSFSCKETEVFPNRIKYVSPFLSLGALSYAIKNADHWAPSCIQITCKYGCPGGRRNIYINSVLPVGFSHQILSYPFPPVIQNYVSHIFLCSPVV